MCGGQGAGGPAAALATVFLPATRRPAGDLPPPASQRVRVQERQEWPGWRGRAPGWCQCGSALPLPCRCLPRAARERAPCRRPPAPAPASPASLPPIGTRLLLRGSAGGQVEGPSGWRPGPVVGGSRTCCSLSNAPLPGPLPAPPPAAPSERLAPRWPTHLLLRLLGLRLLPGPSPHAAGRHLRPRLLAAAQALVHRAGEPGRRRAHRRQRQRRRGRRGGGGGGATGAQPVHAARSERQHAGSGGA